MNSQMIYLFDMNIGHHIAVLGKMTRELQAMSADSLAPAADIYKLATDIILEANKVREILHERTGMVPSLNNIVDDAMRILGGEK